MIYTHWANPRQGNHIVPYMGLMGLDYSYCNRLAGGVDDGELTRADGELSAKVDELGEDELLAPPAPPNWT